MTGRARWSLLILVIVTACVYFGWRITVMNPAHPYFSAFALIAELAGYLRVLLFIRAAFPKTVDARPQAPPGLSVDVAIPTVNEPLDVVRPTLAAAIAMRYPHETWLLDDGARAEMRALAAELGCRYVARTDRTHDKAGNLNHGLAHMRGDYLATFDADHIPEPEFLERTLGHFRDARVAFVQTPHEFRNRDSFDHLRRDSNVAAQSLFNHVIQPGRNATHSAHYCSSAAVVRRASIDAIGGFATGTVNEDTHTSLRLNAAGMLGVFHAEVLALGLGPPDAAAYYGQRQRFAHGAVQIFWRERRLWSRGLTPVQRSTFLFHVIANIEGWRYLIVYALPIVILTTGAVPIAASGATYLAFFLPYFAAAWIAMEIFARGHAHVFQTAVYNLARVPASIRATFTGYRRERRFRVTPKSRGQGPRAIEELFPWLVAGASFLAMAVAIARTASGRPLLAPDALVIVCVWAAYDAATAIRLIALTQRCR